MGPFPCHDSTSDPGIVLRQWVHFQGVHNILDLLSWEEEELKAIPAQQIFTLDDHGQDSYLRTNQVKQICGLITYMKHVFREFNSGIEVREDPFNPFLPEEWNQHTSTMLRTFLIQHLPNPIGPEPVLSGTISSSRPTGYSPAAIELMGFKKGIKREIAAYPSLKDERYFDGFKRSLFVVAKTHECSEVLDPNYTPGSEPEEKELFEAKQTFMFSVFNANLQTDMGKTIVRRHLAYTDAQAVWKELSEHMRTSSKGASEKRRLTQYVTNTVLDGNLTEYRQPLQVQSHLEMPRILVQLGHTQRTWKLAPQTDPKWSPTRSSTRYQDQMSVKCTRRTLRMPSFTRAPHAQPSLSNFTRQDSDFGEPTRSRGTTRLEQNFPTSPQNKKTKLTHRSLYMSLRTISTPHVN